MGTDVRPKDDPALAPWDAEPGPVPLEGGDDEKLARLVRWAVLAPSSHNSQPWHFTVHDGTLELRADRTRRLPVVDPDDRELVISCGAALGTLEVAARHHGLEPAVAVLPDPHDGTLLATVRIAGLATALPWVTDPVFEAITHRRTCRLGFDSLPVAPELTADLVEVAEQHDAWLAPLDEEGRSTIAELVAEGDKLQMADRSFRRELAGWIHPNHGNERDGMRAYGFGMGDVTSHVAAAAIRTIDTGPRQARRDVGLARRAPVVAVLGTEADRRADHLAAGRALAPVLLHAWAGGVAAAFLNQPVEVPDLRTRLAEGIGRPGSGPQLVLAFGYGPTPPPQPRRPVGEVLKVVGR